MATQQTLSTVSALTKEIYENQIQEQLQDEVIGLKRISSSGKGVTSEIGGKYVTFPIRVSRNAGIGYREEDETLQDPGTQGHARVNLGLKYGYGRVRLTGQVMDLAESNVQSFASVLNDEMSGLKDDLAKDAARIFYGDGSGTMAVITGTSSGQVIPVANAQNFFGQIGAVVDIIDSLDYAAYGPTGTSYSTSQSNLNAPLYGAGLPTPNNSGALTVTAVDAVNNTITVSGTVPTTAAGDVICRRGNFGREPYGLAALVGTGALFNLTHDVWKSTLAGNSGTNRPLSEGLMIKMTDDVRLHGGKTSVILTSLGVRREYFNLLTQQRRYSNTKEFAGGLTGLAFNNGREIPVVEDVDAPKNTMYFLDEQYFKVRQDSDWTWLNTDGGIWKWIQNKDAFEAIIKKYWQITVSRRNAQGKLYDITEA